MHLKRWAFGPVDLPQTRFARFQSLGGAAEAVNDTKHIGPDGMPIFEPPPQVLTVEQVNEALKKTRPCK